jgi:hypothetical protein
MKLCAKCGKQLEHSMFCKDRQKKDGLSSYCNPCRSDAAAKRYAENKDKILSKNREWQRKNPEKKRTRANAYRKENIEKSLAYQREWRAKNPDKARGYAAKWREKVGKDKVLESAKQYREANRDKARQASLDWQKRNRAKATAAQVARHAQKLRATPKWANLEEIEKFYVEAERLTKIYFRQYHVDHVVPLRSPLVCGLHCEANLRVIPSDENRSKGNRYWPDMP